MESLDQKTSSKQVNCRILSNTNLELWIPRRVGVSIPLYVSYTLATCLESFETGPGREKLKAASKTRYQGHTQTPQHSWTGEFSYFDVVAI